MTSIPSFNARECIHALNQLGFSIDYSKGKGGHAKAYAPISIQITQGQRPFIIIPHAITRELKHMGISKEQFLEALKK